jgi:hypothetical protein
MKKWITKSYFLFIASLLFVPQADASCVAPSLFIGFEDRLDAEILEFTVEGYYHTATFSGGLANRPTSSDLAIQGEKAWLVYSANHSAAPESTGYGTITLTPPATTIDFSIKTASGVIARIQMLDTDNNVAAEIIEPPPDYTGIVYRNRNGEAFIAQIHLIIDGGSGQIAIDQFHFRGNSNAPPCNDTIEAGGGALYFLLLIVVCIIILFRIRTRTECAHKEG